MPVGIEGRFADALFDLEDTSVLGIAVSGGSDSIALLHLAVDWALQKNMRVYAATVDHQLRPESLGEAKQVADVCARLGVSHDILIWDHAGAGGNLQNSARDARRSLLQTWAATHHINTLLLGHTQDDQAETVLLRLARGSGVDGLAAMQRNTKISSLSYLRPLLGLTRAELRAHLLAKGITWIDDPSNNNRRFDRIKARQMMVQLDELGLTQSRLVRTANHMDAARNTLWQAAREFAADHITVQDGDLITAGDWGMFQTHDTPRRVFAAALQWFSQSQHRPRYAALRSAWEKMQVGEKTTLGGVVITPEHDGGCRLTREFAAADAASAGRCMKHNANELIWDHRWLVSPVNGTDIPEGTTVSALGSAINDCPDWRETGLPRTSLLATPAIWRDKCLIAAPVAGYSNGWQAQIVADFHDSLLAH